MTGSTTESLSDCLNCQWAAFGVYGTYCTIYNEEVIDTSVAQECAEYKGF